MPMLLTRAGPPYGTGVPADAVLWPDSSPLLWPDSDYVLWPT